MNLLFPIESPYPAGFSYEENFITKEQEKHLLQAVSGTELHSMIFQGYEAKRKVSSYGYDWSFEKRTLTKDKEIPVEYSFLVKLVAD